MKISDIMTTPVVTVSQDSTLEQVARLMLEHKVGGVPVLGPKEELAGIITQSDFSAKNRPVPFSMLSLPSLFGHWLQPAIERVYEDARTVKTADVMTRHVVTVREDDPVEEAIRRMCEDKVHRLPVMRADRPVGMVSRQDLLRLMLKNRATPASAMHATA